jgi:DNA-binding transcriptional LysR family regulator
MDLKLLARTDLNLLVTLHVLLEEKSVTHAAQRLFLTQPAISKALGRLREVFRDSLFTRTSRGLVPTPVAVALATPVNELLNGMSDLFIRDSFTPTTYHGEFVISVNQVMDLSLMPRLMHRLSTEAPGIVIRTRSQLENQLSALEEGELDFIVNLQYSDLPPDFRSNLLLSDTPTLFARKGHPLLKAGATWQQAIAFPRVSLHLPDMDKYNFFQQQKGQLALGQVWPIGFATENLGTALTIISTTDYVLAGPGLLHALATKQLDFRALDLRTARTARLNYCLVSHKRVENSAAHQWLGRALAEIAAELIVDR